MSQIWCKFRINSLRNCLGKWVCWLKNVIEQSVARTYYAAVACVASVPVRTSFLAFWPRDKLGREQKIGGRGWVWGGEGTITRIPHDFEKTPSSMPRTGLLIGAVWSSWVTGLTSSYQTFAQNFKIWLAKIMQNGGRCRRFWNVFERSYIGAEQSGAFFYFENGTRKGNAPSF